MKLRKTNNLSSDIESALLYKEDNTADLLNEVIIKEQKIETLELAITKLKDVQQICIELFFLGRKLYLLIKVTTYFVCV